MSVDKTALFAARLPQDDVDIAGVGVVTVRALSRLEASMVQARTDTDARERLILHLGLVDPELTEAEAGQWMKAATASEVELVSVRIGQLSGLLEDASKSAYKSDGDEPGPGV